MMNLMLVNDMSLLKLVTNNINAVLKNPS